MRRTVRIISMALLLACAVPYGLSVEPPDAAALARVFSDANQAYQKGGYASAERLYRQLLDAGVDSGTVYYNLGNACFKQKRLGEAIYFWQKARRKMPGDPDILENLELANLMIVDRIEVPAAPFPVRLLSRLTSLLSTTQESWVVLLLFTAANALFGAYLLAANWRVAFRTLTGAVAALALFLVFGSSLAWKIYQGSHTREGVVIETKTEVRSGPGSDNVTVFTVHEGIQLQVRGAAGGWYQVTLPNGWSGWVQAQSVAIL
jgi:tetratricopeptide (TPR) repeat protein